MKIILPVLLISFATLLDASAYYCAVNGRWLSRDPLSDIDLFEKRADMRLVAYRLLKNDAINDYDILGLLGGMSGCEGYGLELNALSQACNEVANGITDSILKDCIKDKCDMGCVKCNDPLCNCPNRLGNEGGGLCAIICPGNLGPVNEGAGTNFTNADVLVHEFAHKCGWKHGQPGGVPDWPWRTPN